MTDLRFHQLESINYIDWYSLQGLTTTFTFNLYKEKIMFIRFRNERESNPVAYYYIQVASPFTYEIYVNGKRYITANLTDVTAYYDFYLNFFNDYKVDEQTEIKIIFYWSVSAAKGPGHESNFTVKTDIITQKIN